MRTVIVLASFVSMASLVAAAQSGAPAKKPAGHDMASMDHSNMSTAEKIKIALSAGPSDIAKNAAVVEPGDGGKMKELKPGTNGWACMAMPEAMCLDAQWQAWANAWMNKKDPQVKTVGIAYMLRGDQGSSNTDPFATAATPTNHWV